MGGKSEEKDFCQTFAITFAVLLFSISLIFKEKCIEYIYKSDEIGEWQKWQKKNGQNFSKRGDTFLEKVKKKRLPLLPMALKPLVRLGFCGKR